MLLAARIILYGDPSDYEITQSGRIDSSDRLRRPAGNKGLPSGANYAWTL